MNSVLNLMLLLIFIIIIKPGLIKKNGKLVFVVTKIDKIDTGVALKVSFIVMYVFVVIVSFLKGSDSYLIIAIGDLILGVTFGLFLVVINWLNKKAQRINETLVLMGDQAYLLIFLLFAELYLYFTDSKIPFYWLIIILHVSLIIYIIVCAAVKPFNGDTKKSKEGMSTRFIAAIMYIFSWEIAIILFFSNFILMLWNNSKSDVLLYVVTTFVSGSPGVALKAHDPNLINYLSSTISILGSIFSLGVVALLLVSIFSEK